VNATAVGCLAKTCAKQGIPLVHISTDYVFDGSKQGAYGEHDAVSPLGVYGESKLAGELFAQKYCAKFYILRTSWVFSAHGNNFVKTMLRLGAEREELSIVADQSGKPTSAREIANTIYMMLTSQKQAWGTYHIAQPQAVTWFDFAESIFDHARTQGVDLKLTKLHAITTKDYPTPAKRPANSELDCAKLESVFDVNIKPWAESLAETIREMQADEELAG
ncbi:MAG: dTDP-4-dehydrorhamnose reductase, partial [Ghiorsea sp.]|nr:dTDP-4-dehydrorhamnose reductase [Ghiorsea sp.]